MNNNTDKEGRFPRRYVLISVLFALLLLAGAPLTYAAQQSGPGDALHEFEVGVVEKVEAAFQFSSGARAGYYVDRLEERLEELQVISEEPLSDADFGRATEDVRGHATEVLAALDGEDARGDIDILVRASALLDAHEEVLGGSWAGAVDEANDMVGAELSEQVVEYAAGQEPLELAEVVRQEIQDIQDLAQSADAAAASPEVKSRLEDALEELQEGDLGEALRSILEAQAEAMAQEYLQDGREGGGARSQ